ncbi:hypothetical protein NI17_017335 [Thermobifida halotolerans]|uniref:Uncharacterized protein n=1 Tax=Thermobifida halotolerans TaxID=483545 RepID=A0A399G3P2_9ACTN|nr:DUF6190 family protein [Thermobifida halotolerans]UOE18567.1 hypothetical protein NI17_017335 [Thermobifida halotolerans]
MSGDVFVDAALFMGMHSRDAELRNACKRFFADRIDGRVVMSLEQVGRCDDLVWGYPREVQDAYYPFMDRLHTDMEIHRVGYDEKDVRAAWDDPRLHGLPAHERLAVAQALNRGGRLHTASPRLAARTDLPVEAVGPLAWEPSFPDHLERHYRDSLVLTVVADQL